MKCDIYPRKYIITQQNTLYDYPTKVVGRNVLLAGNVLHHKSCPCGDPLEYAIVFVMSGTKKTEWCVVYLQNTFFPAKKRRNFPILQIIAKHSFSSVEYFVSALVNFLLAYDMW